MHLTVHSHFDSFDQVSYHGGEPISITVDAVPERLSVAMRAVGLIPERKKMHDVLVIVLGLFSLVVFFITLGRVHDESPYLE